MKHARSLLLATVSAIAAFTGISARAEAATWIDQSNRHTQLVLEVLARYDPESAGQLGVDGYDEDILDLEIDLYERSRSESKAVLVELKKRLADEEHPKVRQDLQILIKSGEDYLETREVYRNHLLPYFNIPETVFFGIRNLLDPRVPEERRPAAVVRLNKYAGLADGFTPVTELAIARTEERFEVQGLVGPYRKEIEKDLGNYERFLEGVKELFEAHGLDGWQEAHAALTGQFQAYSQWIQTEMMKRAREDNRLPSAVYAVNLRDFGVDIDPEILIERATFGFAELRNEMQALAVRIADQRGWEDSDYRAVIRRLKKEQIPTEELVGLYRDRLRQLEEIIVREKLATLPEREAVIRLASEAESSAVPAPHLSPPRLIGNTGEQAEFVLPLQNPNAESGEQMDDFLYDAVAWTLTAHEARPGHEMQFAAILEERVSIARGVFAFNSANVEGWALYAEAIIKEYLPLEGQLLSLHFRYFRAARAFLDPMLNLGRIDPDTVRQFLMDEVVLSEPMATQEVDRYAFRTPGQATAYYFGYVHLQSLRTRVELALGKAFDQMSYHDFILAQGFLPPELLAETVMKDYVQARTAGATAAE